MKHKLEESRDRDFLRVCRKVLRDDTGPLTATEIAERASKSKAPSYYVTFDYALRMIRRFRSHPEEFEGRSTAGKWTELDSRVRALSRSRGLRETDALSLILADGGASRFFMRPATALRLFQRITRRNRHLRH